MSNTVMTVRFNRKQVGIELETSSETSLSRKAVDSLKALGFKWHRKAFYWYVRYTPEKYKEVQTALKDKAVTWPSAAEVKAMKKVFPKGKIEEKKPSARARKADELAELKAQIAELMALMQAKA